MATLNITNIPAPRVPFIDERTGLMAREWYRFFLNLFVLTGSGNNPITLEELQLGPPSQPNLAELLIQVNQNIAPQYEDQSGDFLATLDTAQLMSMMARFENLEAAIQGAYLNPPQTPTTGGEVSGPSSSTDNAIARFDGTSGKLIQNSVTTIDDTGSASGILSQQFSDGTAVTLAAGKMWYDGTTGAWNAGMGNGNITQQIGEEIFVYGKASAAITDSPLQIIYHTGVVGASGVITFAPTIAGITDVNAIIGVATESLALNGFGRATVFGVVRNITTNGTAFGEVWADDDVIWYNPVTGNPTKVEPVAPNIKVQVGLVIKAGAGGSGSFQVGIARGSKLGGTDSNVQFGALANNNLIAYDTGVGYWKNVTASSIGLGTVTSVAQSFTGGLISVAGSPITTSGTLALTVAGTSGGVPYFSSASTWATSAALAASALVVGGGAGAAPATTTTGTGVVTALGVNTGTAGAFVVNGGALGIPSSGTVTNLTGTASININGTVGATTRNTGLFTTLGANSAVTLSGAAASVHTLGTSATTGTVTIGGTAMTGTLTFGQSTTTNAVNINTGITASGNTKSTYICTNGAAGSTVNVEIGSTLASISNTVVNGRLFAYRTTAGGNPSFRCYGTSTDQNYIQIDSTGGGFTALGVNGSVGAELGTGTTAYATVLGSYVNVPVEIVVNNAKVASFASTGLAVTGTAIASTSVGVGNTTPSGGGAGIAFPATQSASTDANTLDDYEEGTWTPTDASGASLSFTTANCRYTKIGRVVVIQGNITYPATASGLSAQFASFPFAAADSIYLSVIYSDASVANFTYLSGNTTNVFLLIPGVNVTNATMSGKFLTFSGTYAV